MGFRIHDCLFSYSNRKSSSRWWTSRSFIRPLTFLLAMMSRRFATGKMSSCTARAFASAKLSMPSGAKMRLRSSTPLCVSASLRETSSALFPPRQKAISDHFLTPASLKTQTIQGREINSLSHSFTPPNPRTFGKKIWNFMSNTAYCCSWYAEP